MRTSPHYIGIDNIYNKAKLVSLLASVHSLLCSEWILCRFKFIHCLGGGTMMIWLVWCLACCRMLWIWNKICSCIWCHFFFDRPYSKKNLIYSITKGILSTGYQHASQSGICCMQCIMDKSNLKENFKKFALNEVQLTCILHIYAFHWLQSNLHLSLTHVEVPLMHVWLSSDALLSIIHKNSLFLIWNMALWLLFMACFAFHLISSGFVCVCVLWLLKFETYSAISHVFDVVVHSDLIYQIPC